jgi:hypothetical protein
MATSTKAIGFGSASAIGVGGMVVGGIFAVVPPENLIRPCSAPGTVVIAVVGG